MKKHLSKSYVLHYILLLAVLLLAVSSWSYSRYMAKVSGNAQASVAFWGTDTSVQMIQMEHVKPGDVKEYTLEISNTKSGGVSETALLYSISVESTENLPLTYELIKSSAAQGTFVNADGPLTFTNGKTKVSGGTMPAAESVTHVYTLKVSWPSSENAAEWMDEIEYITLIISAQQDV